MSNNVKKNLIDTLNNLLNDASNDNNADQMGGRRYSQKEVDTMVIGALSNIMLLYQKSIADKQAIKEQIKQIMAQKAVFISQSGGSKSYSRPEIDSMVTSSLQHILSLYIQSENEKHLLTNQLAQLQGGNTPVISNNGTVKIVPNSSVPVPKKWSIGAVQAYINSLELGGHSPLEMLVVKDLSKLTGGSGVGGVPSVLADFNAGIGKGVIAIKYTSTNLNTVDMLMKISEKNGNGDKLNNATYLTSGTELTYNLAIDANAVLFGLNAGAKELFDHRIALDDADITKEINLSSPEEFIKQFKVPSKYPNTATNIDLLAGNAKAESTKIALEMIIAHLKENVKPDLA